MSDGVLEDRGLSVRWRLTVVYTAVAVASAAVLLAGIYVLVSLQQRRSVLIGDVDPITTELAGPSPNGDMVVRRAIVDAQAVAVDNTLRNLLVWSAVGLLLMAAVSVLVGWIFAGRALRPVHVITSRARRISADSLDERLAMDGPRDELREMAETFDSLLDRIQEAFASERRLVATMSHELRTPLANQRAALDVALTDPDASTDELRGAAETALGQAVRAERTIDALLALARVQAGAEEARLVPVPLDAMVAEELEVARRSGPDLRWKVDLEAVTVPAAEEILRRAVANLLQNAVVHNASRGRVEVRVRADDGGAVLEVVNDGPVVDGSAVSSLVLPFRRGSADRTASGRGTGLGLTIVQAVADLHHGSLELTPVPRGGLRAVLVLPGGTAGAP
ncbi:sensor histidine kinase [Nocardioides sp. R1-1]|uniref:sensor histidine kinase n=1 Tax=Nocardioides sp. R1-1 TaxID=3383502 RepID=UPI0038CF6CFE